MITKQNLPDLVQSKLDDNDSNKELIVVHIKFSERLEFPTIKLAEFMVGVGEFIDSIPSIFDGEIDENIKDYRIFYFNPSGMRKTFSNALEKKALCDPEIESFSIRCINNTPGQKKTMTEITSVKEKENSIRIEISKLNKTNNLLADLNVCTSKFQDLSLQVQTSKSKTDQSCFNKLFIKATKQLTEITSRLHTNTIDMQIISLKTNMTKYKRLIREYCKKTKKKIRIDIKANNAKIDKRIADRIDEPIIHIIRNAMDHGIETVAKRKKLHKPEEGLIKVTGFNKGGKAIIEISDDGKGINHESIRASCLHKGIFPEDKIENMSREELINCLFLPGFTTSKQVTDISGRGIGMDVVQNAVFEMNGKINIESTVNIGTKFTLILPETLSLIKTIFIECSDDNYAIPTKNVTKVIYQSETKISCEKNHFFAEYDGKNIELYRISSLFSKTKQHVCSKEDFGNDKIILVVKTENKSIGLIANRIVDIRDVDLKPLGSYLGEIYGYSGGIISTDGSIIFVINPENLEKRTHIHDRQ